RGGRAQRLSLSLTALVQDTWAESIRQGRFGGDGRDVTTTAEAEPWLALARSRDPADREQLLGKLTDLCEYARPELTPDASVSMEALFLTLVREAELDIRTRLAARIASADWAPVSLIETLARDDIEVAAPIIAASPLLEDAFLVRLIAEA